MKTGNSISAHNAKVMRRPSENVRGKTKQYTFLAPKDVAKHWPDPIMHDFFTNFLSQYSYSCI